VKDVLKILHHISNTEMLVCMNLMTMIMAPNSSIATALVEDLTMTACHAQLDKCRIHLTQKNVLFQDAQANYKSNFHETLIIVQDARHANSLMKFQILRGPCVSARLSIIIQEVIDTLTMEYHMIIMELIMMVSVVTEVYHGP